MAKVNEWDEKLKFVDELLAMAREGFSRGWDRLDAKERLDRIAEIERALKPCKGVWRAGLLSPPGAPEEGERCTFAPGHEGFCSFFLTAQARGWEIPTHVIQGYAAHFCRKRSKYMVKPSQSDHIKVVRDGKGWLFTLKLSWFEHCDPTYVVGSRTAGVDDENLPKGYVHANGACEGLY